MAVARPQEADGHLHRRHFNARRCTCIVHAQPSSECPDAAASLEPKVDSFNFRIDPSLKAAFTAATAAQDKPAGQVLREFMKIYVKRTQHRHARTDARCTSRLLATRAAQPDTDKAIVLQWLAEVSDTEGWNA